MKSSDFHFKQFSVNQNKSTHKVGTDGVLLGAWASIDNATRILEIGTGSGVISLMLAQRTSDNVSLDAIEIEKEDADQALHNVSKSPWPEKIKIHHTALQDFFPEKKYDLIISNPPYFVNSWLPPDKRRGQARHTHLLSFGELLQSSIRLLNIDGRLAIILPYQESLFFIEQAKKDGLFCIRRCAFRSRVHKPIERLLLEFSLKEEKVISEELTLYQDHDEWSDAYRRLTRDFYLKI